VRSPWRARPGIDSRSVGVSGAWMVLLREGSGGSCGEAEEEKDRLHGFLLNGVGPEAPFAVALKIGGIIP